MLSIGVFVRSLHGEEQVRHISRESWFLFVWYPPNDCKPAIDVSLMIGFHHCTLHTQVFTGLTVFSDPLEVTASVPLISGSLTALGIFMF